MNASSEAHFKGKRKMKERIGLTLAIEHELGCRLQFQSWLPFLWQVVCVTKQGQC